MGDLIILKVDSHIWNLFIHRFFKMEMFKKKFTPMGNSESPLDLNMFLFA